ncbi:hypothetical protein SKAU_G00037460 [Synaphobranchus kaupii]|uniref:Secretory calcium-binding phosphoprotein 9 n=1 Tax=Synaphobranchus kaupii TaxID=118154 RepID=A0A9Q1GGG5_SYNKA|nr:hypothetical protein SKAU_G00037460 [Synaphobranchus kaupii]
MTDTSLRVAWITADLNIFPSFQDFRLENKSGCNMKCIIFVVFAAGILHVSIRSKIALITGLNGGLVTGLNPGLAVAGLRPRLVMANPGLAVAGFNPLLTGGGLIAQPQFAQVFPGIPTYMQPQAIPYMPAMGFPQQQQFPRQAFVPANGGFMPPTNFGRQQGVFPGQQQTMGQPYYMGAQPQNPYGINPGQQQFMGATGNVNQQQRPTETGPIRRYRRTIPVKACGQVQNEDPAEIAATPAPNDALPVPELITMD